MIKNKKILFTTLLLVTFIITLALLYGCGGGGVNGPNIPPNLPIPAAPAMTPVPSATSTPEPSPTQSGARDISLYAVVVGISAYPWPNTLTYPAQDARNFYNALRQSPLWSGAFVATIYDNDATKANIKKYMDNAAARLREDGTFVFFYSGHGYNTGGMGYLVPVETQVVSDMITEDEMQSWLGALPSASKKYVALDSCFSGLFIDKSFYYKKDYDIKPKFFNLKGSDDNFKGDFITKSISSIQNMVAVTGSAGSESSYETTELQSGVMTYYLVMGLGNGASIGDASVDGRKTITAQDSYNYAAPLVSRWSSSNGVSQHLQIRDNYTSGLVIKNK